MLKRVGLTALVAISGLSSGAYAQDVHDLTIEGITEEGDIYGWKVACDGTGCNAEYSAPFVFVVQCDGTYAYYGLPGSGHYPGAKPLGAVRDERGRLMVCGMEFDSSGYSQPVAWLLDGGEEVLHSQEEFVLIEANAGLSIGDGHYASGLFSDVVADEANDRWILVGGGQIGDGLGPVGATTLVIPFESEVEPAYSRYGPVMESETHIEGLSTPCHENELVTGSPSLERGMAWGIQRSALNGEMFHTAGLCGFLENVPQEYGACVLQLPFRDLIGPGDLEMPVQKSFLVEPDVGDWLCCEDYGDSFAVNRASAFEVLETGVMVGSFESTKERHPGDYGIDAFWVDDEMVIKRFFPKDNPFDTLALGASLRSEGWVHAVGMQRTIITGEDPNPRPNVYRVNYAFYDGSDSVWLGGISKDVDRALEWRIENGSPSVFDLNDRIDETEHPGVVLLSASDVNGSGSITGMAYRNASTDDGEYFGYLLTAQNELTDLDQLRLDSTIGCFGDLNNDGLVNGADLGLMFAAWDAKGDCRAADLDGNGVVDGADVGQMLSAWDNYCER